VLTAALIVALVIAGLFALLFGFAYRTADREVIARDEQIRSLRAEVELTQEACDRQTVKARHMFGQAKSYRDEVLKLSARNSDLRDQLDVATGAVRDPSLVEEITAYLGTLPATDDREDNR
jgi:hypothetical protein